MKNLDRIPPYDTHKIGVIYVGPDQGDDEVSILRNQYGSSRYMEFLSGLGELVRLRDQSSLCEVYTGGLERNGADGEFAYSWRSEIAQGWLKISSLIHSSFSSDRSRLEFYYDYFYLGEDTRMLQASVHVSSTFNTFKPALHLHTQKRNLSTSCARNKLVNKFVNNFVAMLLFVKLYHVCNSQLVDKLLTCSPITSC